jgi:hypothetical protein
LPRVALCNIYVGGVDANMRLLIAFGSTGTMVASTVESIVWSTSVLHCHGSHLQQAKLVTQLCRGADAERSGLAMFILNLLILMYSSYSVRLGLQLGSIGKG